MCLLVERNQWDGVGGASGQAQAALGQVGAHIDGVGLGEGGVAGVAVLLADAVDGLVQGGQGVDEGAQFAGSSSVPAHVEMMGLIGMGNNPMVGATVAVAVAVEEAQK